MLPTEILLLIFDQCSPLTKAHQLSLLNTQFAQRYKMVRQLLKVLTQLLHRNTQKELTLYSSICVAYRPSHVLMWLEFQKEILETCMMYENFYGPMLLNVEPSADGWWTDNDTLSLMSIDSTRSY
jgi:hypothetical protein